MHKVLDPLKFIVSLLSRVWIYPHTHFIMIKLE